MKVKHYENFPVRPKVVFFGTPDFAVPSLKALIEQAHDIRAVITQPDRPGGRGRKMLSSPVKRVAKENRFEVLQPDNLFSRQFYEKIRDINPDILIVVAFGRILKKDLLEIPRFGALNIHASLLPWYRGAAPIQRAILNNEVKTGLTAMRINEGLDTGPILLQEEISILEDETAGHLHDRLSGLSGDFILKTLKYLSENRVMEIPQDQGNTSYASKIDRGMALIQWGQSARDISALIRALDPRPGAVTNFEGKKIKLFSSSIKDGALLGLTPGRVSGLLGRSLCIETGKGSILVGELQAPGKKRLHADEFLRGFTLKKGSVLGK